MEATQPRRTPTPTTPENVEGGVEEPATIAIPCDTLEHLLVALAKGYDRQPSREVKQATDTLKRLLEPENNDQIAATV